MAVKMVLFWCSMVLLIIGSNAAGEFDVIHSPGSLSFTGTSSIPETLLKELFSAALGLSVEKDADWDGMTILDPFTSPEAVVEIYVDGVSNLANNIETKAHVFPLTVDEYEPDTFEAVQHRIKQRFGNGRSRLIKVKLSNLNQISSGVFAGIKIPKVTKTSGLLHLKPSVEEDQSFLRELAALKAITEKVKSGIISGDNVIDFYNFRFQSLHDLSDFHGPNSMELKEAKRLLGDEIDALASAFSKAYDGSVLVTVVATDVAHTRRTARAAPSPPQTQRSMESEAKNRRKRDTSEVKDSAEASKEASKEATTKASNEATTKPSIEATEATLITTEKETSANTEKSTEDNYSDDYSAIFNIILWFGIVFAFSLVAIVYAIMDMDPGRDSIIYRMTSTRMKKDN